MKGIIVVKPQQCVGCKACELACAVEHSESKSLLPSMDEKKTPQTRIQIVKGEGNNVPIQCRHCAKPPCVPACPTKALFRKDQESPVVVDQSLCIGCKKCVLACPFGAIRLDETTHELIKCDQCFERLKRGEPPACTESCLTKALEFKSIDEIVEKKRSAFLVMIERSFEPKLPV